MSYRWVEHTAELELEIEAATEQGVFADAVTAIAELLCDDARRGPAGAASVREITATGRERSVLLAAWIDELVYLAETESLVPEEVDQIELSDQRVVGRVRCRDGNPRHLVKGATYHRLAFERSGRGFGARVVLDV